MTSEPTGCEIEVDGEPKGTTPCDIDLSYTVYWVGVLIYPGGHKPQGDQYEIVCYPPPAERGRLSPKKRAVQPHKVNVFPYQAEDGKGKLRFVLRPER